MESQVIRWFVTGLLLILGTVCLIVIIKALGSAGAFDLIAWREWYG